MTLRTGPRGNTGMIKHSGYPCLRCVAIITRVATWNMLRIFPFSESAIMAADAAANHLSVIYSHCGIPEIYRVTVLAYISRYHVVGIFTRCINAVMTTDAALGDIAMVKLNRRPDNIVVAGIAFGGRLHMAWG